MDGRASYVCSSAVMKKRRTVAVEEGKRRCLHLRYATPVWWWLVGVVCARELSNGRVCGGRCVFTEASWLLLLLLLLLLPWGRNGRGGR